MELVSILGFLLVMYKKTINILAKSPVLAHFVTSVQGLITIRAFNSQKSSVQEFENLQDVHSSSLFLMKAVFLTFSFWLDIMIGVYSAIVIFSFLLFETGEFG
jgi:ABC-type transport system involved in cytochrome bd biosynthesis fused ATPase/permease subunit